MPELPDVEGFRRFLSRHATGRTIERIEVLDPALVRNRTPRSLRNALTGAQFGEPWRHGKWLIAPCPRENSSQEVVTDGVEVLMHFGMTGALGWSDVGVPRRRHDRLVFVCQGGELRYNNMRRFGGVWLAADAGERAGITGPLGPDAAALTLDQFVALTERRRGAVKAALMDQFLVAGLGNLMSDEILWRARVHPATPVGALSLSRRRQDYVGLESPAGPRAGAPGASAEDAAEALRRLPAAGLLLELVDEARCLRLAQARVELPTGFTTEGLEVRGLRTGHGLIARSPFGRVFLGVAWFLSGHANRCAHKGGGRNEPSLALVAAQCAAHRVARATALGPGRPPVLACTTPLNCGHPYR